MHVICRQCSTTFVLLSEPGAGSPASCPSCGSSELSVPPAQYGGAASPAEYGGPYAPQGAPPAGYPAGYPPQPYAPGAMLPGGPIGYAPQPINVVIQNQIQYWPMPLAPAPYPLTRRKDAGVAVLLSFFVPGAGQLYNGQISKGLAFLFASMVSFVLLFAWGIGVFTGLVTWIWSMVDAQSAAEKINRGEIVA